MERGAGFGVRCPHCGSWLESGETHADHNSCLAAINKRLQRLEAAADFHRDPGTG